MAASYVLLQEITLNAPVSSITFSSIPQTYTDLKLVYSMRSNWAQVFGGESITLNSTAITGIRLLGNGSAASSATAFTPDGAGANATANTFGNGEIYIPNYTSTTSKSVSLDAVGENNGTTALQTMAAGICATSIGVTTITITSQSGQQEVAGSSFSLYAMAAVGATPLPTNSPYASGGDIIKTDGTYWYHAFLASGTFIPNKSMSCDVLVVGAGAGGGGTIAASAGAGGGGAGGVIAFASQALTNATSYTALVGSGGAIGTGSVNGTNGTSSQFAALTAGSGGGGGGSYTGSTGNGNSGASGGGASGGFGGTGGSATQGNVGGNTASGSPYAGAGGGGFGSAGANVGSGAGPTAGGNGVNTVTNWGAFSTAFTATGLGASGYIAGGGGGGSQTSGASGGSGGGGAGGGSGASGTAGTVNTGSGGGGAGTNASGGLGGSGMILIRYLV